MAADASRTSQDALPDMRVWGKWGKDGDLRYPLIAHLVDTAIALDVLCSRWLPEHTCESLADLAGVTPSQLRATLVHAAGYHDLGKATPAFQSQTLARNASSEFAVHQADLEAAGYLFPRVSSHMDSTGRELVARHEIAGGVTWRNDPGGDGPPGCTDSLIAGHHGRWVRYEEVDADYPDVAGYYQTACGGLWRDQFNAHHEYIDMVAARYLGHDHQEAGSVLAPVAVPLGSALLTLADWLVSSETSIAHGIVYAASLPDNPAEFTRQRQTWLRAQVNNTLGTPVKPSGSFTQIFSFPPDRAAQKVMVKPETARGLSVVMVPTGDGKTEAALGHWLASAPPREGLYFALPTMATADAMFDRVHQFFEKSASPTLAALTHGRAVLNEFYQQPSTDEEYITSDKTVGHGLTPGDWFSGRHRALLAPVTVGTVDQLLSGVLRHKYNVLRLLGASTKTVVLDEVHSYDPYMSRLLVRFLEWAGALSMDVVLLSATLPCQRLNEYVNAYRRGGGAKLVDVEPLVPRYPAVVTVTRGDPDVHDCADDVTVIPRTIGLDTVQATASSVESTVEAVLAAYKTVRHEFPQAKIGIVVNTVKIAQQVGVLLPEGDLIHSRFPAGVRSDLLRGALQMYGKTSSTGGALLIGTQVLEQSLDVDFDVLITQLCPMSSLIQRIGRVWRHAHDPERRVRPAGLQGPLCKLVIPPEDALSPFAHLPYTTAEIVKTGRTLRGVNTINVPSDVQRLVDAATVSWDDLQDTTGLGPAAEKALTEEAVRCLQADKGLIPSPNNTRAGLRTYDDLPKVSGDGADVYDTRWTSEPSVTILPICAQFSQTWNAEETKRLSRTEVLDILAQTIPVSGTLARDLLALKNPDPSSPVREQVFGHKLLESVLVVDLDRLDWITMDPRIGLTSTRRTQ